MKKFDILNQIANIGVVAVVRGNSKEEAIKIAVDYVWETIDDTFKEKKENAYGVNFETKIPYLIDRIK